MPTTNQSIIVNCFQVCKYEKKKELQMKKPNKNEIKIIIKSITCMYKFRYYIELEQKFIQTREIIFIHSFQEIILKF